MELDPIVLLAYMSVALNLITVSAAAVAYAAFRWRRLRARRAARPFAAGAIAAAPPAPPPVFVRPFVPEPGVRGFFAPRSGPAGREEPVAS